MLKNRIKLLVLIGLLVIGNCAVVHGATTVDSGSDYYTVWSDDYEGNIKGMTHSFIVESGFFMHRGRSQVTLVGNDKYALSEWYEATSTIGKLDKLGGNGYGDWLFTDECSKHGYFSSVTTTLETDEKKITAKAN